LSRTQTFVIVGAGLAGAKAAETLRKEGFDGRILLVGSEDASPYNRPPLSKGYLRGERARATILVSKEDFYSDNDIELLLSTRVTALSANPAQLETDSGRSLKYDRLLLATGARPRTLKVAGGNLAGIHYLRTVADADRLREHIQSATRLAVVGAGWIGSEVAASARQMGIDVVLLHPRATPLERVLGPEVGGVFRTLHAEHGVELRPHTRIKSFVGNSKVEGVRTTTGEVIPADLVLAGIGVEPRTELAERAGLRVGDGVVVDKRLRTGDPAIFAAGDVAAAWHPIYNRRLRVEHWANAIYQGATAARNMLGHDDIYDRVPNFFSDQYDLSIEYLGHSGQSDGMAFRGDPASRTFLAFWLQDGRVVAGMNCGFRRVHDPIEALIRSQRRVSTEELADPDIPLEQIAEGRRHDQASTALR
jgi:3-phenylpropionate/trans-cinnamate dioxygenase ferredoxin reductase subunit